jgi:hypothetical protein
MDRLERSGGGSTLAEWAIDLIILTDSRSPMISQISQNRIWDICDKENYCLVSLDFTLCRVAHHRPRPSRGGEIEVTGMSPALLCKGRAGRG